jgi:hypothetical protein
MKKFLAFFFATIVAISAADAALVYIRERATAVAYTGVGDVNASPLTYVGLRSVSAAYATGSNLSISLMGRGSDSHTCQVLITSTGDLASTVSGCSTGGDNGTALFTWCSGLDTGGNKCSVTHLRDQITGGDLVGAATAWLIKNCIGSHSCLEPQSTTLYCENQGTSTSTPFLSTVAQIVGTPASRWWLISVINSTNNQPGMLLNTTVDQAIMSSFNNVPSGFTFTLSHGVFHALQLVPGSTATVNVDGTESSGSSQAPAASTRFSIFSDCGGSRSANAGEAQILEAAEWAAVPIMTVRNNLCHNEYAYWGTATSC